MCKFLKFLCVCCCFFGITTKFVERQKFYFFIFIYCSQEKINIREGEKRKILEGKTVGIK